MKFLNDFMHKIEPDKQKHPFLHTLWDGVDTFLFVPSTTTKHATHIKDGMDLKRTMFQVVIAMQFAFIVGIYNVGHQHFFMNGLYTNFGDAFFTKLMYGLLQFLPVLIVVNLVGLGIEFLFATKKGHGIEEGFLVSGFLIPLIMPADIPLWIVALATAFAVVIAKETFGGTGMNVFNVALVARVFVFFAFPGDISGDEIWAAKDYNSLHHGFSWFCSLLGSDDFFAMKQAALAVDGFSGATPLSLAAQGGWENVQNYTVNVAGKTYHPYSVSNLILGNVPGSVGEVSKIAVILGALILLVSKIASWRIMLSVVLGAAFMSKLLNLIGMSYADASNPFLTVPWHYQFLMGSLLFAMAFMATDPVTASGTNKGKWVYGFMIGVLGIIIRVINPAYPEGWMLAILLMNTFAPAIDYIMKQQNINRRLRNAKV